ncbi:MAG: hypothetical protein JWN17_2536 [Frankiales bacterium]|nr:hypothetical protein [Frankiales bacterium]
MQSRWVRAVSAIVLGVPALALLAVGVHLRLVHDRSYEYRWSPSAAAPRIQVLGRDYLRSDLPPGRTVDPGQVLVGRSEGGGRVYGPPSPRDQVPTVLQVSDGSRVYTYALSGGP